MKNFMPLTDLGPAQRVLFRRTAQGCLESCLLTLGHGLAAAPFPPPAEYEFKKTILGTGDLSYSERSPSDWQARRWRRLVERLARRKLAFARSLADPAAHDMALPLAAGFDLAAFLAVLFIPSAGFAGRWFAAADEAAVLLRLLRRASEASPTGEGADRTCLPLLAVPVLWALVFAHPEVQEAAALRATRADRIWRGRSVLDLFAALGPLPDLLPSLCLAAGILAAVARPPAARSWIDKAARTACRHNARAFAVVFRQMVPK